MSILALGPKGTNGHEAAERLKRSHPELQYHEIVFVNSNRDILKGVSGGDAEYGVAPVENNSQGYIKEVIKEWFNQNPDQEKMTMHVVGEIVIPVRHCLMAASGVTLQDINWVSSHGEAIRQCSQNLEKLNIYDRRTSLSTAAAAREAEEKPEQKIAAIASEFAAQIYGLNILQRDMQDEDGNATRFHLIGRSPVGPTGNDRTAMLFWLKDTHGSLRKALTPMDDAELNMTSIHSIPNGIGPIAFYDEFEGHCKERRVQVALDHLRENLVERLIVMGSYPRANGNKEDK
jgi:chorismate mutase / prephenate dehydratase